MKKVTKEDWAVERGVISLDSDSVMHFRIRVKGKPVTASILVGDSSVRIIKEAFGPPSVAHGEETM